MIITNIKGGLGNQMFQYALGRGLALKNNDELKLDILGLKKLEGSRDTYRVFGLNHFTIHAVPASLEEIQKLKYPLGIFSKLARKFRFKILRQHHIGWEPGVFSKHGDRYVDGFWQSWKYFNDIADVIRSDFTLKNGLSATAKKITEDMQNTNSVSIHIRRGDYVTDTKTNKHHGTCSPAYYQEAVAYLKTKLDHLKLFIFSDDIAWVKEHIPFGNCEVFYVSEYKLPDYEELTLMSKCKHHIIANSSFSWWGAWLNGNKEKIVIAPTQWIADGDYNMDDLLPPTWIRM